MSDAFERAVLRERIQRKERQTSRLSARFRLHVRVFLIVNAGLIVLWLIDSALDDRSSWDDPWFLAVLGGWGIALAIHWWQVRALRNRDAALRSRLGGA